MKKNAFAIIALVFLFTSSSILGQKNKDFWNNHNIDAFDKYFTSNYVYHSAEGDMNGEQYKGLCQAYFTAFPDLHITTDDYS